MQMQGLPDWAGFQWGKLALGAIAGTVGVWFMDRVDWLAFRHEDPAARLRTEMVRPRGLDPAHQAANRAAEAAGTRLQPRQPHPAGIAVHYGLGIAPAAVYAALRHRVNLPSPAGGAALGLGLFLLQDEGINALAGLAGPLDEYPWQAHARGLLAHVVLGVAIDLALDAMEHLESEQRDHLVED